MALRWLVDVGPLWNSATEFSTALSLLPQPAARAAVQRYHHLNDRKLALASQLLQRLCVSTISPSGLKFADVLLEREDGIKGAKPVCADGSVHFNISHHGRLAACAARIASGGKLGVDVVDVTDGGIPPYVRNGDDNVKSWVKGFGGDEGAVFTDGEMELIMRDYAENTPGKDEALARKLFRTWCAKEAYVKAVGTGLVTELRRLEIRGLEGFDIAEGAKNGRYPGVEAWTLDEGATEWKQDTKWKFDMEGVRAGNEEYYVCVAFNESFADGEEWKFLDFESDILQVIMSQ